jgi:hypothetical protein
MYFDIRAGLDVRLLEILAQYPTFALRPDWQQYGVDFDCRNTSNWQPAGAHGWQVPGGKKEFKCVVQ